MNPAIELGTPGPPKVRKANSLLFLGRLGARKGIYVLLEALVEVQRRFPEVEMFCGGDGEIEKVRAEAARYRLDQRVHLLGWVRGDEKKALLETSTVYVLPSFDEGVPVSILEAMSVGLPVISTPVGGIAEVVTHGVEGLLVPPGDVTALSDAICRLLGDEDQRSLMGRNGQLRFEREFNIASVLAQLESIYRELGVDRRVPSAIPS